ncbi:hypothetical protein NDU88_000942 [Pleurodeles waltl]|uniref:Uncharacterized protein n=1 Tax=Pleurodeles waltl TaxID=8319 RepID=A0AAV7P5K3_PLEWA|nr:hypothetical protein NDU88_000942 [Pleurodeles waltl]
MAKSRVGRRQDPISGGSNASRAPGSITQSACGAPGTCSSHCPVPPAPGIFEALSEYPRIRPEVAMEILKANQATNCEDKEERHVERLK